MNFDGFLGNGALKARLQESFRQGKTSHCYLLCGVEGSGRRTLALRMAAALECRDETNPGCGVCPACRKVLSGQHPDVITVDDTEHKNVAVDIIRQARSDVFIRPNEGRKKVYILPRGQDLGAPSQNALLKILEEPPEHLVFILATTELNKVPATILSRCQRHSFKRLDAQLIADHLEHVAQCENLRLERSAAELIAGLAE